MRMIEILPDTWDDVAQYRSNLFINHTLNHQIRLLTENCYKCYGLRSDVKDEWIVTFCVFNKCIKKYPHMVDNKEFK